MLAATAKSFAQIMTRRVLFNVALLFLVLISAKGQETLNDCNIELKDDILSLGNSKFVMEFQWNGGDIKGHKITDLTASHSWELSETGNERMWVPDSLPPIKADLKVFPVINNEPYPDHLVGEITTQYGNFGIRRTFRLYPGVAALAMNLSLMKSSAYIGDQQYQLDEVIALPGKQWKFNTVEFQDITDRNNNLVHKKESLSFLIPQELRGNVLIATDLISNHRLFTIKESPLGESQLLYPGFDFKVEWGEITIKNLGAFYQEMPNNQWIKCYGYVIGPGGETDIETLFAIRDYMKNLRKYDTGRDEMIMMNTWGDRGQDGKINESFVFEEIQAGEKLGISHFQLDDGWQQGLSKNSKSSTGNLWDRWSRKDWKPHDTRFPSGLGPVLKSASEHNIEMGLWFHPSNADSYSFWKDDAEIILDFYNTWGIRTFKIDGMELQDKNADINMRRFFDTLTVSSKGNITFNVDATAGRRGGYFYLNEYGNIFLENRYTDWGKYYPHWTLRNLWMLSEYVPPERLQIEFLNNTRNPDMFDETDPLRPSAIPFDYVFATTMAAQPLAWMESTRLPEEAFQINPLIESYKKVMSGFHQGYIFPIGEIPDGRSWTGFQSISNDDSGYFLIYRENNDIGSFVMKTYLSGGKQVRLEKILGSGESFECTTSEKGEITFSLPESFSYVMFRYKM
ncbi:alpha-galactosidase [Bacteroidota bacterium]